MVWSGITVMFYCMVCTSAFPHVFVRYCFNVPALHDRADGYHQQHKGTLDSYANDTQVHVSTEAAWMAGRRFVSCMDKIKSWIRSNRLKINVEKTQIIRIGSGQQLAKVNVKLLRSSSCCLPTFYFRLWCPISEFISTVSWPCRIMWQVGNNVLIILLPAEASAGYQKLTDVAKMLTQVFVEGGSTIAAVYCRQLSLSCGMPSQGTVQMFREPGQWCLNQGHSRSQVPQSGMIFLPWWNNLIFPEQELLKSEVGNLRNAKCETAKR